MSELLKPQIIGFDPAADDDETVLVYADGRIEAHPNVVRWLRRKWEAQQRINDERAAQEPSHWEPEI